MRSVVLFIFLASALAAQSVVTIAGTGAPGFSGDGGPAVKAQINNPYGLAIGPDGALYFCEIGNHRVRRVDLTTGKIETWLGNGERKPTPDGAPIAGTPVNGPRAITLATDGTLYLVLREGNAVYRIDPNRGRYEHVAGTGIAGYEGDG